MTKSALIGGWGKWMGWHNMSTVTQWLRWNVDAGKQSFTPIYLKIKLKMSEPEIFWLQLITQENCGHTTIVQLAKYSRSKIK